MSKKYDSDLMRLVAKYPVYQELLDDPKYEKALRKAIGYVHESYGGFNPAFFEPAKVIAISQGKKDSTGNLFSVVKKPKKEQAVLLKKALDNHKKNKTAFLVVAGADADYPDKRLLRYLRELGSSKIMPKKIRYMDIGPGKGTFSRNLRDEVAKKGKLLSTTLVDARKVDVSGHPKLDKGSIKISGYNVVTGEHPEIDVKSLLGEQHLIVCKQVLKFHRKRLDQAYDLFRKHMSHGSILITGGPYRQYHEKEEARGEIIPSSVNSLKDPLTKNTIAKVFVKLDGREPMLVRVKTKDFLRSLKRCKSRKEYLRKAKALAKKHAAHRPERAVGSSVSYRKEFK